MSDTRKGDPRIFTGAGRLAAYFINSKLTPLLVVAALLLGGFAVLRMPREEEPQIRVPFVDIMVALPGASSRQVASQVAEPLERLMHNIPGVDHLYSTSTPGEALVTVRFRVGQDVQRSLTEVYTQLYAHPEVLPAAAGHPLVRLRSIYDVPVLSLTFEGQGFSDAQLRAIALAVREQIKSIPDVSRTHVIGGAPDQLLVTLDPARLAAFHLDASRLAQAIQAVNQSQPGGRLAAPGGQTALQAGQLIASANQLGDIVVGMTGNRPILLREVAQVREQPAARFNMVRYTQGAGFPAGHAAAKSAASALFTPAVTLSIAKLQGSNAVTVVHQVLDRVHALQGDLIPAGVHVIITRNYGASASERSNELLFHMALATLSVVILVGFMLGWRESGVVAIAIPVTLLLTLLLFYLYGYTLNRITLFALIFSIGILVDDAIVVVENIVRHLRLPENDGRPAALVAVEAVQEVGNPTILATLAVIAALLPMAFVGGLMGPYMRPIPVGASAAMLLSLLIAFVLSPWAALRLLPAQGRPQHEQAPGTHLYRRVMRRLLHDARARTLFLGGVVVLLLLALALIPLRLVIVKMLPFDNKNEMEVVLHMPAGTPRETTAAVAQRMSDYLRRQPQVTDIEAYIGVAAPFSFNGLVRHYFLRDQPNQADIQVNLVDASDRHRQSHALALAFRPPLTKIAAAAGGRMTLAEVPPGPPVLQTLVAEIYASNPQSALSLASQTRAVFKSTPGVVDVSWTGEPGISRTTYRVLLPKAQLDQISPASVLRNLAIAQGGLEVGVLARPQAPEPIPIRLQLPASLRATASGMNALLLPSGVQRPSGEGVSGSSAFDSSPSGPGMVPLPSLLQAETDPHPLPVFRKDQRPVQYVMGDVAGGAESPAYAMLAMDPRLSQLRSPSGRPLQVHLLSAPPSTKPVLQWDGEWHTTVHVFRDLGIAFAAVLVLIYVLVVYWFRSYKTPLVILAPIPLTLTGILPAHALLGAYFTATSMIGFIAGAGIIVRNSIILVDFIELRRRQGAELIDAVSEAGAVRFRPMLLTAGAVIVGVSVILRDPIFQGLAISLMAGEIASTLISRIAVPVLYYLSERRAALPQLLTPSPTYSHSSSALP